MKRFLHWLKKNTLILWLSILPVSNVFNLLCRHSTIKINHGELSTGWLIVLILGLITLFCVSIVFAVKHGAVKEAKTSIELKQACVHFYMLALILICLLFEFIEWPFPILTGGQVAVVVAVLVALLCVSVVISVRNMEKE